MMVFDAAGGAGGGVDAIHIYINTITTTIAIKIAVEVSIAIYLGKYKRSGQKITPLASSNRITVVCAVCQWYLRTSFALLLRTPHYE